MRGSIYARFRVCVEATQELGNFTRAWVSGSISSKLTVFKLWSVGFAVGCIGRFVIINGLGFTKAQGLGFTLRLGLRNCRKSLETQILVGVEFSKLGFLLGPPNSMAPL